MVTFGNELKKEHNAIELIPKNRYYGDCNSTRIGVHL